MKKLVFLCLFAISLVSCTVTDDSNPDFYYEVLPVESVYIPDVFVLGHTYTVYVTYLKPANCYVFNDFFYVSDQNQRTIAVINTVYPNDGCEVYENFEEEVSFNININNNGTYIFRFWQGEDDNGNDLYYIVEVPVVD